MKRKKEKKNWKWKREMKFLLPTSVYERLLTSISKRREKKQKEKKRRKKLKNEKCRLKLNLEWIDKGKSHCNINDKFQTQFISSPSYLFIIYYLFIFSFMFFLSSFFFIIILFSFRFCRSCWAKKWSCKCIEICFSFEFENFESFNVIIQRYFEKHKLKTK